ncbi:hypothetical protein T12_5231 [Trichinella patagoniensis]|uniref:Uncharacterized protein n=1 Tax=Trichinella patagoniensis TaxID=990121 RepID=A0A0V0ZXF5_9BILA|nr:hypothetical protein T12_5231 [Trichinella patagoniensis]
MMYDRNVTERMLFSYQCGHGWVAPALKRPMQTLTGLWNLAALHFCSFRAQFISTSSSVHTFNITVSGNARLCVGGFDRLCSLIRTELTVVVLGQLDNF